MSSIRWAFNFRAWSPSRAEWLYCNQCIQAEERERIQRFIFKKDAKAAIAGRLLLRKAVATLNNICNAEIRLGRTEKGKPVLLNELPEELQNLSFNVSHQGEYAVVAAERGLDVGIDIMQYEERSSVSKFFNTMKRQFTEQEWQKIKEKDSLQEQLKTFYRFWCLKESYVKALGIGIGFEVGRLDFVLKSDLKLNAVTMDTIVNIDGSSVQGWTFEEQELDNHCISVASHTSDDFTKLKPERRSELFKILTFSEMVEGLKPISNDISTAYWDTFHVKPETPTDIKR